MKLRIRGDSIRMRLKIGEVERIGAGERILEKTNFPGSALTYSLDVADIAAMKAQFSDGNLVVTLPRNAAEEWARNDKVSLVAELSLPDTGTLSVLIEKDFECLAPGHHRDDLDDEDTFPHPDAG
jgi:hypothetical protein